MEAAIAFSILLGIVVVSGSMCGIVAMGRIRQLEARLALHAPIPHPIVDPEPVPVLAPVPVPVPVLAPVPVPVPVLAAPTPPRRSLEEIVGTRWITWVGAIALLVAAGFFVEIAIDRGWLGPTGRFALALAFALALGVAGDRALRRRMRPLGQGLLGAGVGIAYGALYAGLAAYHLYSHPVAFASLFVVTVAGMTLALHHESRPIALLAVLGGLLTPVMASSGAPHPNLLAGYLAILDSGVLAVAFTRRWRGVDSLAMAGTWLLVGATTAALPWVALFFGLFAVTPFAYDLRRKIPMDVERFVTALGNGAVAFALSAHVLGDRHQLGLVALGLAAAYVALGAVARRRIPDDARALFGFVALAVAFVTAAIPLGLDHRAVMVAWAFEAPVLLALGQRFDYAPLRRAALGALGLATLHLFLAAWPLHQGAFTPFVNRDFALAMLVPIAAAACGFARDRLYALAARLGAATLATVLVHAETVWSLSQRDELGLARIAPIAVWTLAALAALRLDRRASFAGLAVAGLFAAIAYAQVDAAGAHGFLNLRFACALAAVGATFALTRGTWRGIAIGGLWLLLSAEVATHAAHPQLALSVTWSGFAIALCGMGFRRRVRPLRVAGLALFALTSLKLVVIDLAALDQLYRVASFLALGLLMIGASWLYHARNATK